MRVLLVSDSAQLQESIQGGLAGEDHVVSLVDAERGLGQLAETQRCDVVVLDTAVRGTGALHALRDQCPELHVLVVSESDRVEDRIFALREGADDYLAKPFSIDELCARVEALARRRARSGEGVVALADLRIDPARKRVTRGGRLIYLTPTEHALLEILVRDAGIVFSKAQLLEKLYEPNTDVSSNVIEVLVSNLRKKIQPRGTEPLLHTRRGIGYVIEA